MMFNKTINNPTQFIDRNTSVSVTEKRAPTDESVRLLKEMEDAAFEKLLGAFEVKNNMVSGSIIFFARTFNMNIGYRVKFKINGEEGSFDGIVEDYELIVSDRQKIVNLFFKRVSEGLVSVLLSNDGQEISKNLLGNQL